MSEYDYGRFTEKDYRLFFDHSPSLLAIEEYSSGGKYLGTFYRRKLAGQSNVAEKVMLVSYKES